MTNGHDKFVDYQNTEWLREEQERADALQAFYGCVKPKTYYADRVETAYRKASGKSRSMSVAAIAPAQQKQQ